ncbi:tetratricopeptide repeat protein [Gemmata sp.]|uniref:tetratricopeptide repeat protein n=1 Tax=Gemmata sp. TaxID=1914242 RepID=UPI003F71E252
MWTLCAALLPELELLDLAAAQVLATSGVPRELRDALASLTAAVEANPADAEARFRRGAVWQALGRPAEAVADLREAVRLVPGHARAWLLLSEVLPALDEHEAGRDARTRAVRLDPTLLR